MTANAGARWAPAFSCLWAVVTNREWRLQPISVANPTDLAHDVCFRLTETPLAELVRGWVRSGRWRRAPRRRQAGAKRGRYGWRLRLLALDVRLEH
jgi:hypothetical protein